MYNAIWGTYYHYCSTDEKPQHEMYPGGEGSWCSRQQALATYTLSSYTHDYPTLPADIAEATYPIYEDLGNIKYLESPHSSGVEMVVVCIVSSSHYPAQKNRSVPKPQHSFNAKSLTRLHIVMSTVAMVTAPDGVTGRVPGGGDLSGRWRRLIGCVGTWADTPYLSVRPSSYGPRSHKGEKNTKKSE
ncbi:uncharacterized protein TNIN_432421 [Trichonephila inaurata madagascariensis]|uniref:Uncharacterized protein n=1 Tax=Trichonephila inaurata madagascariensis TaxID=2747483 RepID=A0A8X6YXH3_9ARAC|nr:uncharacterized protein TNIN_432421 [Trichonephila inaurata madagascariensis]